MTSLSAVESTYPGVAIILLGDFNKLNVSNLKSSFKLKQIVPFPTQGPSSLDLIITNLQNYYDVPERRPAFGLSDHISVEVMPKLRSMLPISRYKIKSRDLRPSNRKATGLYLKNVDISPLISNAPSCSEKAAILETVIKTDLDTIVPFKSKTIYANEPPWINPCLKNLIKQRQKALAQGNLPLFRLLRNRVNQERKYCRGKYYETKVAQLKDCEPSKWWKEVKKLCGLSQNPDDCTKSLQQIEGVFNKDELANKINETFLLPMNEFQPLSSNLQSENVNSSTQFEVSSYSVYIKLLALKSTKAQGPYGIPAWVLKENADILAGPITNILNCSYRAGCLPASWKEADIVPIPKQSLVTNVDKHLRPISLTPILAKIGEEFVVEEFLRLAILRKINHNQFGSIPKSSSVHALISMLHTWSKYTDGNGTSIRVILFDYRKAFDLIDHN
jgi:hypothetical protein